MPAIADLRARLWSAWHSTRLRWWEWQGRRIAARELRELEREKALRIKRQLTSPIANTSLTGGRITHRRRKFIR